jgi:NADH:ubiquinone oxidoreductase subunit 6 (subunit J)
MGKQMKSKNVFWIYFGMSVCSLLSFAIPVLNNVLPNVLIAVTFAIGISIIKIGKTRTNKHQTLLNDRYEVLLVLFLLFQTLIETYLYQIKSEKTVFFNNTSQLFAHMWDNYFWIIILATVILFSAILIWTAIQAIKIALQDHKIEQDVVTLTILPTKSNALLENNVKFYQSLKWRIFKRGKFPPLF